VVRRRLRVFGDVFSCFFFTLHFRFLLVRCDNKKRFAPQECVGDSVPKLKIRVIQICIVPRRYERYERSK
jgi:hypothetical protein